MKLTLIHYTIIVLIGVAGIATFGSYYYRSEYKEQERVNGEKSTEIKQLNDFINHQNTHIDMLHEMDTKRTQKLASANAEIDRLHTTSLAHPERVYIKATCPVPKTPAPSGMDDAATARPTDTAVGNYWVLRKHIATSEQMILGLQDYIKTQCK
ncbi:putative Rac prophage; prophage lambda endopeptidase [Xenorhabdus bovienii str. puntauvense]|uniref:Putative Rac prophage prophage lambda endopeptidase n=1 Tax=Xenorhabdus bovienii str. puntauvense TaxID=1398201 RepID=A0A077NBU8_XENBV|nr:putative Rac prophage; prophage lambda endopeptidase [Xenorhabdus bovienii str. puntauvense]